ncbi:MAG: preprotein translocase subunit SecG [Rickettsiella sp.]|nr:preprotein translocase subunit SecG [Rickettsiella sp.]
MLQQLLLLFHVLISVGLVTLVLLQQGKGAEMGASFGSGASQTVFGSQGSSSFLFKLTGLFALLFFVTSLSLGYMAGHRVKQDPIQKLAGLAQQLPLHTKKDIPNLKNPVKIVPTQTTDTKGAD